MRGSTRVVELLDLLSFARMFLLLRAKSGEMLLSWLWAGSRFLGKRREKERIRGKSASALAMERWSWMLSYSESGSPNKVVVGGEQDCGLWLSGQGRFAEAWKACLSIPERHHDRNYHHDPETEFCRVLFVLASKLLKKAPRPMTNLCVRIPFRSLS